jgi:hypothetical protein
MGVPRSDFERKVFATDRLDEFCSKDDLEKQTGHKAAQWLLVIAKELIDNALDEAEKSGISPEIEVAIVGDKISVTDNGPGIAPKSRALTPTADHLHRAARQLDHVLVAEHRARCLEPLGKSGRIDAQIEPDILRHQRGADAQERARLVGRAFLQHLDALHFPDRGHYVEARDLDFDISDDADDSTRFLRAAGA